jgi:hypothetical protein
MQGGPKIEILDSKQAWLRGFASLMQNDKGTRNIVWKFYIFIVSGELQADSLCYYSPQCSSNFINVR